MFRRKIFRKFGKHHEKCPLYFENFVCIGPFVAENYWQQNFLSFRILFAHILLNLTGRKRYRCRIIKSFQYTLSNFYANFSRTLYEAFKQSIFALGRILGRQKKNKKMSLSGVMCKYKHIGTDVEVHPYVQHTFFRLFSRFCRLRLLKPESGHQNNLVCTLELAYGAFVSDSIILASGSVRKVCPVKERDCSVFHEIILRT